MKLCKDCEYFKDPLWWDCSYKRDHSKEVSLITGKSCVPLDSCQILRSENGSCGPEGKWFERKKWSIKRLFK